MRDDELGQETALLLATLLSLSVAGIVFDWRPLVRYGLAKR